MALVFEFDCPNCGESNEFRKQEAFGTYKKELCKCRSCRAVFVLQGFAETSVKTWKLEESEGTK